MSRRPGEGEPDSVWTTIAFPFPAAALRNELADTELLFRLHPHLDIAAWRAEGGGHYRLAARHELSGAHLDTRVHRRDEDPADGFTLAYDAGLKRETAFRLADAPGGSELTVTERYSPLSGSDDPRRVEVDETLLAWVLALHRHLLARRRWAWLPGWRWWQERFLPGMAPRQRRIVRLIVWISALEFLVFAALVAVWRLAS
jgi:hypothetical protein